LLSAAGVRQQKALFHLTAKNNAAGDTGSELIAAELRRLATNAVNTPV